MMPSRRGRSAEGFSDSASAAAAMAASHRNARYPPPATYVLEHLATFTVSPENDLVYPADGMRRLLAMEKTNGIWTQKMLMKVDEKDTVNIIDQENKEIVERFPLDLVREPTAFTSNDPKEMYNNILIYIVGHPPDESPTPAEMHIFQCSNVRARDVVEDLKALMMVGGRRSRGGGPHHHHHLHHPHPHRGPSRGSPRYARSSGAEDGYPDEIKVGDVSPYEEGSEASQGHQRLLQAQLQDSSGGGAEAAPVRRSAGGSSSSGARNRGRVEDRDEETGSRTSAGDGGGEQCQRDVVILNRCFDDIEKFISRLQHAATAFRELEKRRRNRLTSGGGGGGHKRSGNHKDMSNLGDGMLSMRAKPPPEREFVDIFQKFKLSFNLLAKLKAHIQNPNAPELVHFLFTPLALIVDASHDSHYGPNLPSKVVSPLLTSDAVNLLINCLTSKENELWHSLGEAWFVPEEDWKPGHLPPPPAYRPIFIDGWSPPPQPQQQPQQQTAAAGAGGGYEDNNHHHHHHNNVVDEVDQGYHRRSPMRQYAEGVEGPGGTSGRRSDNIRHHHHQPHHHPAAGSEDEEAISVEDGHLHEVQQQQKRWADDLLIRGAKLVRVTHPRTASNGKELTVVRGEFLEIMDDSRKWWKARNIQGQVGHVPHTIVTPFDLAPPMQHPGSPPQWAGPRQDHPHHSRGGRKGEYRYY